MNNDENSNLHVFSGDITLAHPGVKISKQSLDAIRQLVREEVHKALHPEPERKIQRRGEPIHTSSWDALGIPHDFMCVNCLTCGCIIEYTMDGETPPHAMAQLMVRCTCEKEPVEPAPISFIIERDELAPVIRALRAGIEHFEMEENRTHINHVIARLTKLLSDCMERESK